MAKLDELLRSCTVRVMAAGGSGSGVFVAPGRVLTCAHVVEAAQEAHTPVTILWSRTGLELGDYSDLCREAQQPMALLTRCAERFEVLRGAGTQARP